MNKLVETFKKFLPDDQLKEVSAAVDAMMQDATEEITSQKEVEFNKQLENAYNELSAELQSAERTAEQGYEEAFAIIADLRNRLEVQREEFEKSLEEGFEEAYQHLLAERAKNGTLEVDLYEEYEKKYLDLKEQFVDMLHEFLNTKGSEIYEQAKRDLIGDPRYAEHKVALDKIAEIAANYLNGEEVALATSSKLEEAYKSIEEMKGQIKVMEARNIRLARENEKLNESVSHSSKLVTESRKVEKKERVEKGKNVSGRGNVVAEHETRVIAEHNQPSADSKKDTNNSSTLLESLGLSHEVAHTLAGTKRDK